MLVRTPQAVAVVRQLQGAADEAREGHDEEGEAEDPWGARGRRGGGSGGGGAAVGAPPSGMMRGGAGALAPGAWAQCGCGEESCDIEFNHEHLLDELVLGGGGE
jgi:hypothetical protein